MNIVNYKMERIYIIHLIGKVNIKNRMKTVSRIIRMKESLLYEKENTDYLLLATHPNAKVKVLRDDLTSICIDIKKIPEDNYWFDIITPFSQYIIS
jgi:hypothetical protein